MRTQGKIRWTRDEWTQHVKEYTIAARDKQRAKQVANALRKSKARIYYTDAAGQVLNASIEDSLTVKWNADGSFVAT